MDKRDRLAPCPGCESTDLIVWARERWRDEVANRPLCNIHRRTLDDTWRQVLRHLGADPVALLGPSHDDLRSARGMPNER